MHCVLIKVSAIFCHDAPIFSAVSLLIGMLRGVHRLQRTNPKERLVLIHVLRTVAKAQDLKAIPHSTNEVFVVQADELRVSNYVESAEYRVDCAWPYEEVEVRLVTASCQ
jgi:hypothetical protein